MGVTEPQTIHAVDNAFAVIHALKERGGAGVTELSETLDLSKSTVHSHLKTLEQLEYVIKDGDVYRPGLRWLEIGGYVRKKHRLCERGNPRRTIWRRRPENSWPSRPTSTGGASTCISPAETRP